MDIKQYIKDVISIEARALEALEKSIDDKFVDAVNLIAACNGKVIVSGIGKSGHVGKKIAASLASTGTPAFFLHSAEAVHGDLGMISSNDVVMLISNSGETAEVVRLLPIIKKIGAKTIALTKASDSSLATQCDAQLTYPLEKEADHLGLAPTTSAILALSVGDALAVTVSRLKNFTRENFHLFHPGGSLGQQLQKETRGE